MMNLFSKDFSSYKDNYNLSVKYASDILREGKLSLITGAGVSMPLGLPSWNKLVKSLCESSDKCEINELVDGENLDLKFISEEFKKSFLNDKEYLNSVQNQLYKSIKLDLSTIHKPMMTALTSLFIGNFKGRVRNVITYNFDNLLNWYLTVLGLNVNTEYDKKSMNINEDCSIFHVHGYLPHPDSHIGDKSKSIVFTKKEFDRNIRKRDGVRMQKINSILTRTSFLAVGVSYDSLLGDLAPEIESLKENWYLTNDKYQFQRDYPFGFTIQLTELNGEKHLVDIRKEKELLQDYGIITIKCRDIEVPETIFKITQSARFN